MLENLGYQTEAPKILCIAKSSIEWMSYKCRK